MIQPEFKEYAREWIKRQRVTVVGGYWSPADEESVEDFAEWAVKLLSFCIEKHSEV